MTENTKVPERASDALARRLPGYFRELREMEKEGKNFVSSKELAERMGFTDSQIRHDLNSFGGFGRRGRGYQVSDLRMNISRILDIDRPHRMIIIGAGNIGRALTLYPWFPEEGFVIQALFDVNPAYIGQSVGKTPVLPIEALKGFLTQGAVDIAVIATPHDQAQGILDILVQARVPGVWNFTGRSLEGGGETITSDIHLSDSLYSLSFRIHEKRVLSGEKEWTSPAARKTGD